MTMLFALPVSIPWSAPKRRGCLQADPRWGRAQREPGVDFSPLLAWVRWLLSPSVVYLDRCASWARAAESSCLLRLTASCPSRWVPSGSSANWTLSGFHGGISLVKSVSLQRLVGHCWRVYRTNPEASDLWMFPRRNSLECLNSIKDGDKHRVPQARFREVGVASPILRISA